MNHFMDYVCRGIVRSEDAVRCLNKRVVKLTKCCRQTNTAVICLGVSCLVTLAVVAMQDREIKALQKQVTELTKDVDDYADQVDYVASNMEGTNQQEGA